MEEEYHEYPDELLNLSDMKKKKEDRKLELRLAPPSPGEFHFHGCCTNINSTHGTKRAFQYTAETKIGEKDGEKQCQKLSCIDKKGNMVHSPWSSGSTLLFQNLPVSKKLEVKRSEDATADSDTATNINALDKRSIANANSPVVGWPPIRSSRKNLSLSKPASEKVETAGNGKPQNPKPQLFVKINMEGIPIGRKVNLTAYHSYEQLSLAIHHLFSALLAAQKDSSATQNANKSDELTKPEAAGSLAGGNGEYTLIYEDDEGDRVLVGDVPWHMFVSTAKRLHVLKSSQLSTLPIGSSNEKEKTAL
ncbi:AUX/IAA protein [Corchorus capsularis]|uniref:Auxin-responsive protein n=1 Tax=Corchorus capsularis TaxID=210143 RepID=A0A1R3JH32_COCAP|nr:AUX/IAA protein [Corchorus capsularis]